MPKRKEETNEERKLRKIRKLEKKLQKYKEVKEDAPPSSDLDDPEVVSILAENELLEAEDPHPQQEQENMEPEPQEEHKEQDLPQDILAALGQGKNDNNSYGEEINPEILKIMTTILTNGLEKEAYEQLSKASKIPINAKLLDAPKLNNEFLGLLLNSMSNRDKVLKDRQQDLGRGIALVMQSINKLTKKDYDKLELIKTLSDGVRLLCNLHHNYTVLRRKLIAPVLDKALIQNLNENQRSEYLYSHLEESMKTSTAIKITINILKPKAKNYQSPRRHSNQAQNQTKHVANNAHYKSGGQGQTYKPHHRNYPRPTPQVRPTRRPQASHRGGRARYP